MNKFLIFLIALMPIMQFAQTNTEVFLFDLNTENDSFELSNFKNISNNEGYDNQPSFMDDNTILYTGTRNGQTDIVKYNLQDGSKEWLSDTQGSEYSPLKIPLQKAISVIRLEENGEQNLYRYDLINGTSEAIIDNIVIGYQLWMDRSILISSTLQSDQLNLTIINFDTNKNLNLDYNIGRSLQEIPFIIPKNVMRKYIPRKFGYIDKKTNPWSIVFHDINNDKKEKITDLLLDVEDFAWINSKIVIGKGNLLYVHRPEKTLIWKQVASLEAYGINNITRLAVSPDGTKLAVVGELTNQKLEQKLENIKWISGNWKGDAFGGLTEENWSEPSGGSMMATFKLTDKGEVVFYEIEIIREVENSLILQLKHFDNDLKGWETKDETVDFPLKEITVNKVVFEGMTFEKISDSEINVYVDIHQDNGEIEVVKFNYKK